MMNKIARDLNLFSKNSGFGGIKGTQPSFVTIPFDEFGKLLSLSTTSTDKLRDVQTQGFKLLDACTNRSFKTQ
jgi:hypothetical protein